MEDGQPKLPSDSSDGGQNPYPEYCVVRTPDGKEEEIVSVNRDPGSSCGRPSAKCPHTGQNCIVFSLTP